MIKTIEITNYKSIENLTVELGQVTVLIGENGSGKSNILEAMALASAAANTKLGNEFLIPRGVRVTEPQLMRAGFDSDNSSKNIEIAVHVNNSTHKYALHHDNKSYSEWLYSVWVNDNNLVQDGQMQLFDTEIFEKGLEMLEQQKVDIDVNRFREVNKYLKDTMREMESILNVNSQLIKEASSDDSLNIRERLQKVAIEMEKIQQMNSESQNFTKKLQNYFGWYLPDFLIYAPENTALRNFNEEGQIQPLGVKGEGLFKLLSVMSREPEKRHFAEVKAQLQLFDWFDDFDMPNNLFPGERRLQIKDRYLDETIAYFDQRSANEGFLYLLFYFTLFISDYTPQFFAIDNIDASLNPKLCQRLIQELVMLAKKHGKQVIMTTHNPAILDGLDLTDEAQKLHVVYRNLMGQTKVRPVAPAQPPEGEAPIRLSEAFLKGYLGGLPQNF